MPELGAIRPDAEPARQSRAAPSGDVEDRESSPASGRRQEPSAAPFFGRSGEVRQLRAVLGEKPPPRQVRQLVVRGPAGMGKTRLLEEAWAELTDPPARVDWVAEHWDGLMSFGPVARWLQTELKLARDAPPTRIGEALERLVEATAGLDAQDALFLGEVLGLPQASERLGNLPPSHLRADVHRAIGRLIAARAGETGVCLVVDQAQWLDPATAGWLKAARDGNLVEPLTIVILTQTPPGKDAFSGHPPDLEIELGPLAPDAVGALFDAVTPALEFLPELRRAVLEQKIGTPAFVQELSRLVRQVQAENAGPIRGDQVANIIEIVPASLDDLIARRIALLGQRDRQVMACAALIGWDCSLGLLESFDQIREGLVDHLRALEGMRFIERHGGSRLAFLEGRTRALSYDALLPDERRALHRQIAAALRDQIRRGRTDLEETLAYHLTQGGDPGEAAEHLVLAAERRRRLGEAAAAARTYDEALERMQDLDPTPTHQTRMARVLARRARLALALGAGEQAIYLLEAALSLADALGNPILRLTVEIEQALTQLQTGSLDAARAAFERLEPIARELGHTEAICVIQNGRGVADWQTGRLEEALTTFRNLGETAQRAELSHLEADALNNTGLIYWRWGRYAEAAQAFRSAAAIRMRTGDRFGLVSALLNLAIQQEQVGEIQPARRNYAHALELAGQLGFVQGEAALRINLSSLALRTGAAAQALEHAARGLTLARKTGDRMLESAALLNLGVGHALARRRQTAVEYLESAFDLARKLGADERAAEVELYLLANRAVDPPSARSWLERCAEVLRQVEREGWRDLFSRAHRVQGQLLRLAGPADLPASAAALQRSLDYAVQLNSLFDERETLQELRLLAEQSGDAAALSEWTRRAEQLEALLEVGSPG